MIRPALLALAACFAIYAVSFTVFALLPRQAKADIAVVFGNQVLDDGTPSSRLGARLDTAVTAYRSGLAPRILVSGARGASGFDEAVIMRQVLMRAGIPAEAILVDSHGTNTVATARNTMRIIRPLGLRRILVVTQYFHIPRCLLAFHQAGAASVSATYPGFVEPRDVYSLARELVAFPYLLCFGPPPEPR